MSGSEDPQNLLEKYTRKGYLEKTKAGEWTKKEVVQVDHIVGVDYNSGEETDWIKIHHSLTRTHIVGLE
ncbi:polymorphic toxin type 50 domain-containing protein [Limosilactobacillus fermentum]|uniref:polymorphic toxin type 50 domain-containing protein n=1 Tax=Limosilactobacillus fermentum TaxID=1613 RepID=UPI001EDAE40C|nr:polymorphic toxin type 50 domain-containing protein [Limosilactobacillus fermentum]